MKKRDAFLSCMLMLICSLPTFAENIPLPEHPRPDFERKEWINLNGKWDFTVSNTKEINQHLMSINSSDKWVLMDIIPLSFNTYHPQGLLKIGDNFYLTSVKVTRSPKYKGKGRDRVIQDEGAGIGYLFQFDPKGNLIKQIELGEGTAFHPGGMDYDGQYIWIPITKYYPYSESIIVRFDPVTQEKRKIATIDDSIGAIIHDTENKTLIGMNWDAREFLYWPLNQQKEVIHPEKRATELQISNKQSSLAIQDAKYIGQNQLLGFGIMNLGNGKQIGGFEIRDTRNQALLHQLPLSLKTTKGVFMTNNPSTVEKNKEGLHFYFIPEDNLSTLYIYELKR